MKERKEKRREKKKGIGKLLKRDKNIIFSFLLSPTQSVSRQSNRQSVKQTVSQKSD